jgi:general secretion pathway protein I
MKTPDTARGFTLIEVLIALVVAATALTLGFGAVGGSAQRLARVEESMLTRWAIENVVADLTLRAERIEPGRHVFDETLLGRGFVVTAEVERDAEPPVLVIDLVVAHRETPTVELDHQHRELLYARP